MNREELHADAEEAVRTALDGLQARIWTAIPGIIVSADLDAGEVSIQPAIKAKVTTTDPATGDLVQKFVELPPLIHCPIVWPTGGGFVLTFPLKAGDEVLALFASRAIDSWFQSGGVGLPVEGRMHDLSDGFALVGVRSGARKIGGVSAEAVQLRNDDGTAYVEINDSGDIKLKSPGKIGIEAGTELSLEAGTELSIKAGVKLVLDAPVIAFRAGADMIDLGLHTHGATPPPTLPIIPPVGP